MGDALFEFLRGKAHAVGLRQRETIVFHVIADRALNPRDAVHAAGYAGDHVYPVDILHARTGHSAAVFLRKAVQPVGERRGGGPGINRLFRGGDHIDAALHAFFHMRINVFQKAEKGHNGNVCVAFVQNSVRVAPYGNAELASEPRVLTHVLPDDIGVHIDRTHDLRAFFIQITNDVLGHFAAAVLYNLDLFHEGKPPC